MSFGYERSRWALVLVVLAGACKQKAPPVLFHSDVHLVAQSAADVVGDGAPADVPVYALVSGTPATGDGSALTVDGVTVASASGERFTQWLRVDLDGDGQAVEVVAARVGVDGHGLAPAVFRKRGVGYELVALPGAAPTDPRCGESTLRQTSPRSVVVSWRCPALTDAQQPIAEEQLLIGLAANPVVRRRASLLAGALPDTALELRLEGADIDGDGQDEIVVGLAAGRRGQTPRASARSVFFERAGAMARDTSEPTASLQANLAAARRALASGRAGAVEALATLDDYLRLRRAFCLESSLARIRFDGATGFDCHLAGPLPAAELYARTLVNVGETPAAEAQVVAETATDFGVVSSERVLGDIERAAFVERAVIARPGPFAGAALDALAPTRSGALTFNRAVAPVTIGLHGPAGGMVDVPTLTFTQGPPGAVTDVLARSPDGATRVTGFVETCEGVAVVTCPSADESCVDTAVTERVTALAPSAVKVALPALPSFAFSQRCTREPAAIHGVSTRRARVMGWGREGLVVAVDGLLYKVTPGGAVARLLVGDALGAGFPPGAAVSESGAAVALAGLGGVWVRERSAWRRWSPDGLAGRFALMTDLTVSNDARIVAAMTGTQLWVLERPRAPARR